MPPKFKFDKEEIVQTAVEIVRKHGWNGLSARSIAKELNASTKPIYGYFKSMAVLEEEVVKRIVDLLYDTMIQTRTGDPWHDHGIGYAMFGFEEKKLFLAANDDRHVVHYREYGQVIWDRCTASLADYPPFKGLSDDQIFMVQFLRWLMAHGLAFQAAIQPPGLYDEAVITEKMQTGSRAILSGLKMEFQSPGP
ncbi:MAG: TetR/AcrR family transcriptional regulator [Desulfobacteraceae bacterium]|nr:TetR/AcrR family transcriptional regulator [Desulfobacteraceae bacterium]MBC2749674.1 TetR/AcrR family transcriptional regulator [Desulfobacteraceae bacterium]